MPHLLLLCFRATRYHLSYPLQDAAVHQHCHRLHVPVLHVPLVPPLPPELHRIGGPLLGREGGGAASEVGARHQDGAHLSHGQRRSTSGHEVHDPLCLDARVWLWLVLFVATLIKDSAVAITLTPVALNLYAVIRWLLFFSPALP